MRCYNCGSRLTEHDFCTNCSADVTLYKKIVSVSNLFYNRGLEKAGVRDLSGAISSLRQCLKLNKNNVEARNLLGLIYFEMGEPVAALSEWVISKNLRPKKNIADNYIEMLQSNQGRLDSINQTIKKYNLALSYCQQGNLDLAVIQLKKVLSLNPKFVQAHQLLALLYLNREEWDKAQIELIKCSKIDANNTMTLRYMQEIKNVQTEEEGSKAAPRRRLIAEDTITYQSGNETIIQPMNVREPKGFSSIVNIIIGIGIGLAAAWFLILPARINIEKSGIDAELKAVSEQMDVKTASITELEQKITDMTTEKEELQTELEAYVGTDGTLEATNNLLEAAKAYIEAPEDTETITGYLDKIDNTTLSESKMTGFTDLYDLLLLQIGPSVGKTYYTAGMTAYESESYQDAVDNLQKAFEYDKTNGDALFNLGNAYRKMEDAEKAIDAYKKVIELFPGTEKASRSQAYINELQP